jgi:hypothetical protein
MTRKRAACIPKKRRRKKNTMTELYCLNIKNREKPGKNVIRISADITIVC